MILEIMDKVGHASLQIVDSLARTSGEWDNVARNDFCR